MPGHHVTSQSLLYTDRNFSALIRTYHKMPARQQYYMGYPITNKLHPLNFKPHTQPKTQAFWSIMLCRLVNHPTTVLSHPEDKGTMIL